MITLISLRARCTIFFNVFRQLFVNCLCVSKRKIHLSCREIAIDKLRKKNRMRNLFSEYSIVSHLLSFWKIYLRVFSFFRERERERETAMKNSSISLRWADRSISISNLSADHWRVNFSRRSSWHKDRSQMGCNRGLVSKSSLRYIKQKLTRPHYVKETGLQIPTVLFAFLASPDVLFFIVAHFY